MKNLKLLLIALIAVSGSVSYAGTLNTVQEKVCELGGGAPYLSGISPGTDYDELNLNTSTPVLWLNANRLSQQLDFQGALYWTVTWSPSYSGESPPAQAVGTFLVEDQLYGPSGSSASITTGSTTLDSTLGTQGTWNSLGTTTVARNLLANGDGTYTAHVPVVTYTLNVNGTSVLGANAYLRVTLQSVTTQ